MVEGRDATRTFRPMTPMQAIEGIAAAISAVTLLESYTIAKTGLGDKRLTIFTCLESYELQGSLRCVVYCSGAGGRRISVF